MAKQLKIGLFITTYNRPDELRECLESLGKCDLKGVMVMIIDDGSNDETVAIIKASGYIYTAKSHGKGIKTSIKIGYETMFSAGCDAVINLDGDAIVKPNFIQELTRLYKQHPDKIITGFHSMTQGRHPVISWHKGYCIKKTVGGINMMMNKVTYERYVKPALTHTDNWDRQACINAGEVICAVPSLVQHIGITSSMNHNEEPDTAVDFYRLELPQVTLVGATGSDLTGLIQAADISTRDIKFGVVRLLSHLPSADQRVIPIEPLLTKEAYNEFIVRRLWEYIDTEYLLIIQPDGYVVNWCAWNDEFLQYDLVGATWPYKDGRAVGNGGFSLRTRALMQRVSEVVINSYPEDHQICRTYRDQLTEFKWAPAEVADRFSIEAYGVNAPFNKYCGSFGFHGWHVDFTGVKLPHMPAPPKAKSWQHQNAPRRTMNVRNGIKYEIVQQQPLYKRRW